MLRHAGANVDLIDLSGKWDDPRSYQLLRQSRFVIVVGDPAVTKWQASDFRKLDALEQELFGTGGAMIWIANKDMRFSGRSEWLSLFPKPPAAAIPLLPQEAMINAQWNGRWFTDDTGLKERLVRALEPVFALLYNEINTH
jgi:serine/threonine-protein kinase